MEINVGDVVKLINGSSQELYLILKINNKQRIYASKIKESLSEGDKFYIKFPNNKYYFQYGYYYQTHVNKVEKSSIKLCNSEYIINEIRKIKASSIEEISIDKYNRKKLKKDMRKESNKTYRKQKEKENKAIDDMKKVYKRKERLIQRTYSKTKGLYDPTYKGPVKEIRG